MARGMWLADVTNSQVSLGFGCPKVNALTAFSHVVRDWSSYSTRPGATPNPSSTVLLASASVRASGVEAGGPPANTSLAWG